MARTVVYLAWAPFFSGAERALLVTLRSLDPTRYRPFVVVGTDGELLAQLKDARIPCEFRPLAYVDLRRPISWFRSVAGIVGTCRRVGAALVHANDVPSFQPGGYAARLLRLPAITHLRFPMDAAGYRWFLRPPFSRAVLISKAFESEALQTMPEMFRGRMVVINDGIQVPPSRPEERETVRASVGLGYSDLAVSLSGQVADVKGIWDLVGAAGILRDEIPDLRFVVVGDDLKTGGAVLRDVRDAVKTAGVDHRFLFLGFRRDAPRLAAAFDIAAVPSHVEPLGLSALEAMAAGCPVVATAVGGLRETVVHDQTGLLVEPHNPVQLAEAVRQLAGQPELRARFGQAGRQRVIDHFSAAKHARELQDLYDMVLSDGP